jgi:hypothetical protein
VVGVAIRVKGDQIREEEREPLKESEWERRRPMGGQGEPKGRG